MRRFFGWVIFLGIIFYLGSIGIRVLQIYLNYSDIEDKATMMMKENSEIRTVNIPEELMQKAKQRRIPLKEDSIKLVIDEWEGERILQFAYHDSLLIFNKRPVYFHFSFCDTSPLR